MLCFLFLLLGLMGLQTDDNSERLRVQITVPEKIRSTSSGRVETYVSYKIVIEGKTYTVNLMQKAFLPHNFRVYGYNGTGSKKPLEQQFQNLCYYQGYIEGYPNSMVIVSTCTGLRGLLQFENVSYGIEPLEPSIGFEHVIYQVKHRNTGASLYAEKDIESREKPYKIQSVEHPRTISLESLAVIIAQLLSLSMGITYDDINKCHCPGPVCVMNPEAIHSSGVKIFSNCSMEDFAHFLKSKSQCLQNQPRLDPTFKVAVCGNGEVEEGEQCDCGNQEACAALPDSCCNQATCRLNVGSACATGPCCDACAFIAKGQVCRVSTDECDLSEYCNGTSAACQEDLYVQDGHPCAENQWVCVNGRCMNGIKQCSEIFGEGSGFGTQECFDQLNSKTDPSGNCGSTASGYTQCNPNGHTCVGLEYAYDDKDSGNMWVKDGTVCGLNKVCKNKKCVDSSVLNYDCTPEKCHNQGLCNNKRHCHCNPTYLPPNCQVSLESWEGGSIDSGNFPPSARPTRLPDRRYIENFYYSKPMRWPFFLLIPFFIILCVLIATLVKVYFQRKKWRTEDYTSDEQLESESGTKD
uniref:Disintegrin and metalloproteinase domain-containing protein 2 n=1 Tax=Balaenoptera musculus TaxID=9771 RepID=A0A8C0DQ86_BALMU